MSWKPRVSLPISLFRPATNDCESVFWLRFLRGAGSPRSAMSALRKASPPTRRNVVRRPRLLGSLRKPKTARRAPRPVETPRSAASRVDLRDVVRLVRSDGGGRRQPIRGWSSSGIEEGVGAGAEERMDSRAESMAVMPDAPAANSRRAYEGQVIRNIRHTRRVSSV